MQIQDIAVEKDLPILCAGDFFHKATVSNKFLNDVMDTVAGSDAQWFTVAGNHDLPGHRFDNLHQSALGIMDYLGNFSVLRSPYLFPDFTVYPASWDQGIRSAKSQLAGTFDTDRIHVLLTHFPVFQTVPVYEGPWMLADDFEDLCAGYGYDLAVTGDTHRSFVHKGPFRDCDIVNPGNIMRYDASMSQIEHEPSVYIWNSDMTYSRLCLDCSRGSDVLQRDHIDQKKETTERREVYLERLNHDAPEIIGSFKSNLWHLLKGQQELTTQLEQLITNLEAK